MKLNNRRLLELEIKRRYQETGLDDLPGTNKIDSGSNRIVYRIMDDTYGEKFKGMVLKINYPYSNENNKEYEVWKRYHGSKYENYLVPIFDYGDEWILMPYGEPINEESVDQELYNTLSNLRFNDLSYDDFVYLDGRYSGQKCCDYASLY